MSRAPAPPAIETLFAAEEVRDTVAALGRRIDEELGGEDPLLIALLGGSVIFLADLVRAIPRPVRYEFIDVAYHVDPAASEETGTRCCGSSIRSRSRSPARACWCSRTWSPRG